MRTYKATRVSPGSSLVLEFEADSQMNLDDITKRTIEEIRKYYKSIYKEVIDEFSHVFKNIHPPYVTIVIALSIGYGDTYLEYHTFIAHKPNKLHNND
jgi:hypothetical protein